jgi:hypothetical protein
VAKIGAIEARRRIIGSPNQKVMLKINREQ